MIVLFNMLWLVDTITPNFTITRRFDNGIVEYVYSSKKYFTDVWPPKTCTSFPIKSVIREDGVDVTRNVLKFSGPKRNYINPLGVQLIKKKVTWKYHNFGIRFELGDYFEEYHGTITVTDIFGNIKIMHV